MWLNPSGACRRNAGIHKKLLAFTARGPDNLCGGLLFSDTSLRFSFPAILYTLATPAHLKDSEELATTSPKVDVWRSQTNFPAEESDQVCASAELAPSEFPLRCPFHHSWI